MSLLWKTAMAWHDFAGSADEVGAKRVTKAGFKGYVGSSSWEENEPENQDLDGFDEDLWDKVRPEPHKSEKPNRYGDMPGRFHQRHEKAYMKALDDRQTESKPDIEDDDLHEFIHEHGSNTALWQNKAKLGKVDLSKGVYATQSHVGQTHIDRYLDNPDDETWHRKTYPTSPRMVDSEHPRYLGDEMPMFVTHQGRLHCTEGHHRVAAALQRGEKSVDGWHYDADQHGLPGYEDD